MLAVSEDYHVFVCVFSPKNMACSSSTLLLLLSVCVVVTMMMMVPSVLCAMSGVHVDPDSGHFVDELGRRRLFHGVNVVYKPQPFYPPVLDHFDVVCLCTYMCI